MKLIDMDAAIECIYGSSPNRIKGRISALQTVDAVDVVRCRDCTHYNAGYECLIEGYGVERDPEWFCGDGERKDVDNHDTV